MAIIMSEWDKFDIILNVEYTFSFDYLLRCSTDHGHRSYRRNEKVCVQNIVFTGRMQFTGAIQYNWLDRSNTSLKYSKHPNPNSNP